MSERVWIGIDTGGTKTAAVISAKPPVVLGRTALATLPSKGPDRCLDLIKAAMKAPPEENPNASPPSPVVVEDKIILITDT